MRLDDGAVPEGGSLATLRGSYGLFIGGPFVAGASVFKTISPATEEVLAEVTHGATEDVDRAVAAARHAYERTWSVLPGRERARYLLRIARLLRERAPELAVLESLDSGKPIRQTREVDLPLAVAHFFYHAGWAVGTRGNAKSRSGSLARCTCRWPSRTSSTTRAGQTSWPTPGSGRPP